MKIAAEAESTLPPKIPVIRASFLTKHTKKITIQCSSLTAVSYNTSNNDDTTSPSDVPSTELSSHACANGDYIANSRRNNNDDENDNDDYNDDYNNNNDYCTGEYNTNINKDNFNHTKYNDNEYFAMEPTQFVAHHRPSLQQPRQPHHPRQQGKQRPKYLPGTQPSTELLKEFLQCARPLFENYQRKLVPSDIRYLTEAFNSGMPLLFATPSFSYILCRMWTCVAKRYT